MKFIFRTVLAGAGALLLSFTVAAQALDLNDPAAVETFMDGLVKPLMKNNNSPSGVVTIIHDGRLLLAKGYGYQDVEERVPVDPARTLFRPGSTSKLFTWVAVMQLVEQGKLDLDTDVNRYLETFQIKEAFGAPVTLRHILTHTAGFEDGSLGYLILEDPALAPTLREAMARYQPKRVNPPGVQTAYSNYATALAGLIVANVSGLPFNEYIEQNIFAPLGMNHSSFREPLPDKLLATMANSYTVEAGDYLEKPFEIITGFGPAGAMSSSGMDMMRFAQAILNGGELDGQRILKPETLELMLAESFSQDPRMMGMALGFYAADYNGNRVVGHGGDTRWFHSYLGIDPTNDLALFVSFSGPGGSQVRSSVTGAFYDAFFPVAEQQVQPPEDFNERAARYAGTYGFWRSNFSTIEKALGLTGGVSITPTENNTLVLGFAGNAKQYAEVAPNLFRELNPNISLVPGISPPLLGFQENDQGEITGFVMDGLPFMSLRKLAFYQAPGFSLTWFSVALLIFLWVLLRRYFQRGQIRLMPAADRSAIAVATYTSAANWLVVLVGGMVLASGIEQLFMGIPLSFKLWLWLPIVASLLGAWLLFKCVRVWQLGLLEGAWARIRFTLTSMAALFVIWFYYYWNILGFQYY